MQSDLPPGSAYFKGPSAGGGVFFDGGDPTDFFSVLRIRGFNMVRLRIGHSPPDGHSGLAETLELAERARSLGLPAVDRADRHGVWG